MKENKYYLMNGKIKISKKIVFLNKIRKLKIAIHVLITLDVVFVISMILIDLLTSEVDLFSLLFLSLFILIINCILASILAKNVHECNGSSLMISSHMYYYLI